MEPMNDENSSPVRPAKAAKRLPEHSPFSSVTPSRRRPLKQQKQRQFVADPNLEATLNESTFDASNLSATASEVDRTLSDNIESQECMNALNRTENKEEPIERNGADNSEEVVCAASEVADADDASNHSVNLTLGMFKEEQILPCINSLDLNDAGDRNEAVVESQEHEEWTPELKNAEECVNFLNLKEIDDRSIEMGDATESLSVLTKDIDSTSELATDVTQNMSSDTTLDLELQKGELHNKAAEKIDDFPSKWDKAEEQFDLRNETEAEDQSVEKYNLAQAEASTMEHVGETTEFITDTTQDMSFNMTLDFGKQEAEQIIEACENSKSEDLPSELDKAEEYLSLSYKKEAEDISVEMDNLAEASAMVAVGDNSGLVTDVTKDMSFNMTLDFGKLEAEQSSEACENAKSEDLPSELDKAEEYLSLSYKKEAEDKSVEMDNLAEASAMVAVGDNTGLVTDATQDMSFNMTIDFGKLEAEQSSEACENAKSEDLTSELDAAEECLDVLNKTEAKDNFCETTEVVTDATQDLAHKMTSEYLKPEDKSLDETAENMEDDHLANNEDGPLPLEKPASCFLISPVVAEDDAIQEPANLTAMMFDEEEYSENGRSFIEAKEEAKQDKHVTVGPQPGDSVNTEYALMNDTAAMFKDEGMGKHLCDADSVPNVEMTPQQAEGPVETTFTDVLPYCKERNELLTESLLEFEQIERQCLSEQTFQSIIEEEEEADSSGNVERTMESAATEKDVITSLLSISDKVATMAESIKVSFPSLEDELNAMDLTLSSPGSQEQPTLDVQTSHTEAYVTELMAQLETVSQEKAALENQVAELAKKAMRCASLEDETTKFRAEIEDLTEKAAQASVIGDQLRLARDQVSEMAVQLEAVVHEKASMETQVTELSQKSVQYASLEQEKNNLMAEIEDISEKAAQASVIGEQLRLAQDRVNEMVAQLDSVFQEKAALENQVAELAKNAVQCASLEDETTKLRAEIEDLTEKAAEASVIGEQLLLARDQVSELAVQLEAVLHEKASMETQVTELSKKSVQCASLEQEKINLVAEIEDLSEKAAQALVLGEKLKLAEDGISEMIAQMNAVANEKDVLEKQVTELANKAVQCAALEEEKMNLKAEIGDLSEKAALALVFGEKLKLAEDGISDAIAQMDAAVNEKAVLENQVSELANKAIQCSSLEEETFKLRAEIVTNSEKAVQAALVHCETLRSAQDQVSELTRQLETVSHEKAALEDQVAELAKKAIQFSSLEEETYKLRAEIEDLTEKAAQASVIGEQLRLARDQVSEMAVQLEAVVHEKASMETQVTELSKKAIQCSSLEEETYKLRAEIVNNSEKAVQEALVHGETLRSAQDQVSELTRQLETVFHEKAALEDQVAELAKKAVQCASLEEETTKLRAEIDDLSKKAAQALLHGEKLRSAQHRVSELTSELEAVTQEKADVDQKVAQIVKENEKLESEVEKLGKYLDDSEESEQRLNERINEYELRLRELQHGNAPGLLDALKEGRHEISQDKSDDADSDNEAKFKSASSSPTKPDRSLDQSVDVSPLRTDATLGHSFYNRMHDAPKTPGTPSKKANESTGCRQQ